MPEPIDTSKLGPVRFDPDRPVAAARRVRAAIDVLRHDPATDDESDHALMRLSLTANDAVLAKLEGLLRLAHHG